MSMMHHRRIRYIGLDVHKASISVAIAEESGPPTSYGKLDTEPSAMRKLMTRLGGPEVELRVAYEAGPTGYALHRQLTRLGIDCMVVAPSLIPTQPGNKVKTDKRDALKLARLLRSGDLTPVWVPDFSSRPHGVFDVGPHLRSGPVAYGRRTHVRHRAATA